jgi:hypothetical protein
MRRQTLTVRLDICQQNLVTAPAVPHGVVFRFLAQSIERLRGVVTRTYPAFGRWFVRSLLVSTVLEAYGLQHSRGTASCLVKFYRHFGGKVLVGKYGSVNGHM